MASTPSLLSDEQFKHLTLGEPRTDRELEVRLFFGHEWVATGSIPLAEGSVLPAYGYYKEFQISTEQLATLRAGKPGGFSTGGNPVYLNEDGTVRGPTKESTMANDLTPAPTPEPDVWDLVLDFADACTKAAEAFRWMASAWQRDMEKLKEARDAQS